MQMSPSIIFLFSYLILFSGKAALGDREENSDDTHQLSIGAIVDCSSRISKEETTSMNMAIQDYYKYTRHKPFLHIKESGQDPVHTAFSTIDLLNNKKVGAIVCFTMCDQVAAVAELSDRAHVPILSFADTNLLRSSKRWPFLIQAKRKQYQQMRAVAAIVGTWQWRKVNVIYEDDSSTRTSIFPLLIDSLQQVGSYVSSFMAIEPFNLTLSDKLEKLKGEQCRVFVVHMSLNLANHLFKEAKKVGLMEKDSVWITTNHITDHLDFVNSSVISTLQGILGVGTYFPRTGALFKNFKSRFQVNFHIEHPKERSAEPGISALQAYDAVWLMALAMEGRQYEKTIGESSMQIELVTPFYGKKLLENILSSSLVGLTGDFHFIERELEPSHVFRVVNVVGKSYRELGYWSEGHGFSKSLSGGANMSMKILGQLLWPGGPWSVPRGWAVPTSENPLTIGVPDNPEFDMFTSVKYDAEGEPIFSGISIALFKSLLDHLPYNLPYTFIPYNGTYNALVEQVHDKNFDAAVGDIAIVAKRDKLVEFSHPWSDSGIQMIVYRKSVEINNAWLFIKPFTKAMWGLTAAITIYNGFSIWLMERRHNPVLNGSVSNRVGAMIWLAFITLFSLHGERLHTNLSRMTMVVWLFVAIIIIQSYTASLTSMLTIPHLELNDITVDFLQRTDARVGCDGKSFVPSYLENVIGFKSKNIEKFYSKTDYFAALQSGEISAAFLEVPYIRLLMSKDCKNLVVVGESLKAGGFGFAFPRGSPMLPDITQAILQVQETGELQNLENSWLKPYNCSSGSESDDDKYSLGVPSFWGLFVLTFGTSTISLMLYFLRCSYEIPAVIDHEHDPRIDEQWMFAPEMANEGQQIHLGTAISLQGLRAYRNATVTPSAG